MRDIFYYELRKRAEEIRDIEQSTKIKDILSITSKDSYANKNMLLDTVEKLIELSNIARRKGTLTLESTVYEMDDFPGIKYLQPMILLICDGTSPEDLEEALYCRYFSAQFSDYAALQYLIMMYGVMSIQVGRNIRLTEETLLNMLPEELTDAYRQNRKNNMNLRIQLIMI